MSDLKEISSVEVDNLNSESGGITLIDVRTPEEFSEVHVVYAKNIPLDSLSIPGYIESLNLDKEEPIYFICRSGGRSKKACNLFMNKGFKYVYNVSGGTLDWLDNRLPAV